MNSIAGTITSNLSATPHFPNVVGLFLYELQKAQLRVAAHVTEYKNKHKWKIIIMFFFVHCNDHATFLLN